MAHEEPVVWGDGGSGKMPWRAGSHRAEGRISLRFCPLNRRRHWQFLLTLLVWLLTATGTQRLQSQDLLTPAQDQRPSLPNPKEHATRNPAGCLEPPPLPGLDDYNGPLQKAVGIFARALERKSAVHQAQYKPGTTLCMYGPKDKFWLFVDDSLDPVTFISAGFDAGIDQANNRDPSYGQGVAGYTRRFASNMADRVSWIFWKDFAYPSLFEEDPRYFPLGRGPAGERFLHAAEHLVIAHSSDGKSMFNYSEWLGTGTAAVLSNLHHPGQDDGAWPTVRRIGYGFAWDVGFDVLREFWPDIARKLKLPFRGASATTAPKPDHR